MNVQRVVVIGGGVAGRAFAVAASRFPFLRVTVVDPSAQPVFEDLLLGTRVAQQRPLPSALLPQLDWQKGRCVAIDVGKHEVVLEHKRLSYEYVVLATGARPSFVRVASADVVALSPWRQDGRLRIAAAMRAAEELVHRGVHSAIHVVVVGGGRVGVAAAGRVIDFAQRMQVPVVVSVVEQHTRLLTGLPHAAAQLAERALVQRGVRVQCGARVEALTASRLQIAGAAEAVPFAVCIWAADSEPVSVPAVFASGNRASVGGHTNSRLQLRGCQEIYALGDVAVPPVPHRGPTQGFIFEEALYVSEAIALASRNKQVPPFSLRHHIEEMVYVGGGRMVSVEAKGCRLRTL